MSSKEDGRGTEFSPIGLLELGPDSRFAETQANPLGQTRESKRSLALLSNPLLQSEANA